MEACPHLLNRQIQTVHDVTDPKFSLRVLQWNALARCYTSPKHYPLLSREIVEFDNRKDLISKEIKSYEADIICLEEVDKTDLKFFNSLYPETYSFSHAKKPHSRDGTCIMIKKSFEIIEEAIIEHTNEEGQKDNLISQIVVAKHFDKEIQVCLIVVTCHLKADTWTASCEHVRLRQAKQIIEAIEKKKQLCLELLGQKKENIFVIVCGDFNDNPGAKPTEEFLSHKELSLKSAYHDAEYTLFQMYGYNEYTLKSVVDYVMYSDNLVLTKKLSPPEEGKIGKDGLLDKEFPSDHLPLFCEFAFQGVQEESK